MSDQRQLTIDRDLLNAKFEGYKLQTFPEESHAFRTVLPTGSLKERRVTNTHRYGFHELQARVRFNHLAYGHPLKDHDVGTAFYIDRDYNVVAIAFHNTEHWTRFFSVAQLNHPSNEIPNYTLLDGDVPTDPQYPSLISLSENLILASNGAGEITLIGLEYKEGKMTGVLLTTVCYQGDGTEGISPIPCVLLSARLITHSEKIVMVVYSQASGKPSQFNLTTLEMDTPSNFSTAPRHPDGSYALGLSTQHIQRGPEVPIYCAISHDGELVMTGSETRYRCITDYGSIEEPHHTGTDVTHVESIQTPAYEWTQDSAEIVVHFSLPKKTNKSAVSCDFKHQHLSLMVRTDTVNISYPFRKLWATVQPQDCTWTIEPSCGLLSLYLTKVHETTRWPHLFDADDGVLETVDKSQLSEIAERLARFTSDDNDKPIDNNVSAYAATTAQHPAATDMDEDVDEEGNPIVFTVFDRSGRTIQDISSRGYTWLSLAFATPTHEPPSVCVKMDVDGIVFDVNLTDANNISARHTSTFDAFSFVRASKRDTRFVYHDPYNRFVSIVESRRNLYIYFRHRVKKQYEPQTLVDITRGYDEDVLGVQLLLDDTLAILTESELLILRLPESMLCHHDETWH